MLSHIEPSRWLGNPFGNLRRARFVLVAAFAILSAISFHHLLSWKRRTIVTGSVGPPLVTSVRGWRSHWFEAWDWQTNRSWILARSVHGGSVVLDDKTLAWIGGNSIYTVDIASPGEVRLRPRPRREDRYWPHLIGMSADERFVVFFERFPNSTGARNPDEFALEVFDLETGEKTDLLAGHVVTKGTIANGLMVTASIVQGKPAAVRATQIVRLSPEGKLTPVNQVVPQFGNRAVVSVARTQGNELEIGGAASAFGILVLCDSPRGDAFVAGNWPWQSCFVGNATTVHELPIPCSPLYFYDDAQFSPDGTRVAICDARDDLHIIDVQSGQIVAQNFEGTQQRQRGRYCFAAALLLASAWYVLLLRETTWNGSLIDASAILLLLGFSAVAFPNVFGIDYGMAYLVDWLGPGLELFMTLYLPLALIAACGVAVAWYWVFGTGTMLGRWLRGALWLLAMATPSVISFSIWNNPFEFPSPFDWPTAAAIGVVVAGVVSAAISTIRLSRWTVAKGPVSAKRRQFDLKTMMTVVAGASVVLAIGRVLHLINPNILATIRQSWSFLLAPLAVAVLLPSILLSNYAGRTRISLMVMVGVATLLWSARWPVLMILRSSPMMNDHMLWEQSSLVTLILVLGLLCKIARQDGWRWVRVGASEPVTEMHPVQPAS